MKARLFAGEETCGAATATAISIETALNATHAAVWSFNNTDGFVHCVFLLVLSSGALTGAISPWIHAATFLASKKAITATTTM